MGSLTLQKSSSQWLLQCSVNSNAIGTSMCLYIFLYLGGKSHWMMTCASKFSSWVKYSWLTTPHIFRWCNIKALPGATRLIKHLMSNGVPTALASNSPRSNIEAKISCHQGIPGKYGYKESFFSVYVVELLTSEFVPTLYRMERVFLCNCWWRWSREGEAIPRYVRHHVAWCHHLWYSRFA
jgi:hypothetical protein